MTSTVKDGGGVGTMDSKKGGWFWLLAKDGGFSMVKNSTTVLTAAKETKRKREILPLLDITSTTAIPANKILNHNAKKIKVDKTKNLKHGTTSNQGRWNWLLQKDGSHFTIDNGTVAATAAATASAKTNKRKRRRETEPCTSTGDPSLFKPRLRRNADNVREKPSANNGSRWCWLLAEDGSFATVDSTTTSTNNARKRQRAPESTADAGESSPSTPSCRRPTDASVPNKATAIAKKANKESSWFWLLAKDHSFATIGNTTAASVATMGKNQQQQSNNSPNSPGPGLRRSFRPRFVDGYNEDDEYTSEATDDEDDDFSIRSSSSLRKRRGKQWVKQFRKIVAYKRKHKTVNVPSRTPLGDWVRAQRSRYKHGKLEKERIARLESIGFEWRLHERIRWKEMFDRLVEYKKKYQTTCVPYNWKGDPRLAQWVNTQRKVCKWKDRVDLLINIGFVWNAKDSRWNAMYSRLVAYKQKYQTTRVPQNWKEDPELGIWVSHQRQECKLKDRVDLLNNIGFVWNAKDSCWNAMYSRLVAYKQKYQTTRVPKNWKEDPKLVIWVNHQRQECKLKDRVDLLNNIGFVWDAREM